MKTKFVVSNPVVECVIEDRKLRRIFRGVAKCSPVDNFDEEKGKKIAQLRAEIKRGDFKYQKNRRVLNSIVSQYCNNMDNIYNMVNEKVDLLEGLL